MIHIFLINVNIIIFFPGGPVVQDALRESFIKLVRARFVERCPAPEPFLAPQSDEETPARKRGAKSAKVLTDSCQFYYLMIIVLMPNQNRK